MLSLLDKSGLGTKKVYRAVTILDLALALGSHFNQWEPFIESAT